ncbi:MAG: hypothetical protein PVG39_04925 [Desulfobacteraceae bacterium]|jgi:hypothetical protein
MESTKKRAIKVLDSFYEALGDSEEQTIEELKEELVSSGIDIKVVLSRIKTKQEEISNAARRSILEDARKKRLKMENKNKSEDQYRNWSTDSIKEKIKDLITTGGLEVGLAYRDLESMGIEELVSVLEDLELTQQRREIEEDNDE